MSLVTIAYLKCTNSEWGFDDSAIRWLVVILIGSGIFISVTQDILEIKVNSK